MQRFPLPQGSSANLNTATFDKRGQLWLTGQSGVYGRLDPKTGKIDLFDAPRGVGPYGISTPPDGQVLYASFDSFPLPCPSAQVRQLLGRAR